jgi:hypothetical protein
MSEPTLPPWWGRHREKQNARSRRQERRHAAERGGKVQPGSGSSWRAKGDVRLVETLDELKYTDAASFRLTVATWNKIERAAHQSGREPRLIIEFSGHDLVLEVTRQGD